MKSSIRHLAFPTALRHLSAALSAAMVLAAGALLSPPAASGGSPGAPTVAPVLLSGRPEVGPWLVFVTGEPLSNRSTDGEVQRLRQTQDQVARSVMRAGGSVVSSYESVANAMLVELPHGPRGLRSAPGVRRVVLAPRFEPALGHSVPYIGATRATNVLGLDGSGVTIAVVDTGVDAIHVALGGSGDAADYAANDPAVVEPGTFPTSKVVGGWDFAGSDYDPGCSLGEEASGVCQRNARPDPDPTDEQAHGTHVASIAAGEGSSPPPGSQAEAVAPGVAPRAQIVALKIFGRRGASTLLLDALEWIVRARTGLGVPGVPASVDVVNLSVGSPYAWGLFEEEGIVRRVVASGVVVVAAAGNDGDRPYVLSSPAAAHDAIAVGAVYDDGDPPPAGAGSSWPDSSRGPARPSWAPLQAPPLLKPDIGAPGGSIFAASAGTGTGGRLAGGTSMAAPHVAGAAALLIQSDPALDPEAVAATLTSTKAPLVDARAGYGQLDAWSAAVAQAHLGANALAGVDLGTIHVQGSAGFSMPFRLTSHAARERWFTGSAVFRLPWADHVPIWLTPGSEFHLDPRGSADGRVAGQLPDWVANGPGPVRGGLDVARGAELASRELVGTLRLTETDESGAPLSDYPVLSPPVYGRLEATSAVSVQSSVPAITAAGFLGAATIDIANTSGAPGPVESFLWFGDDGLDEFVAERVDVRQMGARLTRDAGGEPLLEFAATYVRPDATPVGLAMGVYLDTDDDGALDWLVVGADADVIFNGELSGEWATVAVPFAEGSVVPDWSRAVAEYYGDVRLDGAYSVVRVRPGTIGLAAEPAADPQAISFFMAVEDRLWTGEDPEVVDVAPGRTGLTAPERMLRWAPGEEGLAVSGWTTQVPRHSTARLRAVSDLGANQLTVPPPPGVLLVYPFNDQATAVAEAIPISLPGELGPVQRAWLPAATVPRR